MNSTIWIGVGVAFILVVLFRLAYNVVKDFRYYRGMARKEFVDYVRRHHSNVEVLSEGPEAVVFRKSGAGEIAFPPQRLYLDIAKIDLKDVSAKERVFEKLFQEIIGEVERA